MPAQDQPAIAELDTQRMLRRTLQLTSREIREIDLDLAAEAGLLKTRAKRSRRQDG